MVLFLANLWSWIIGGLGMHGRSVEKKTRSYLRPWSYYLRSQLNYWLENSKIMFLEEIADI